jgi:alpha,alpha-trehalase
MLDFRTPDKIYGELFNAIQRSGIWEDDKVIADLIPLRDPDDIMNRYNYQKLKPGFSLEKFVQKHFRYQAAGASGFKSDTSRDISKHIDILWDVLKRDADTPINGSSLIPLPYPYIVPGGRFNEIYYWDSYFTMLGLQASGKIDIIENMVNNFAYLIEQIGFIPNGNRTYFLGRSQPPFFALMVELLAEEKGNEIIIKYLPELVKEYQFWMKGEEELSIGQSKYRVVRISEGTIVNRYFDNHALPRQEMYATDIDHALASGRQEEEFYLDVRSACESGWDFSCRWLKDSQDLFTIRTSQIIPIDLNSLLAHLETTIAKGYRLSGEHDEESYYLKRVENRRDFIINDCWDDKIDFYTDLHVNEGSTDVLSLAGMFPLFLNVASQQQAERAAKKIKEVFLKAGGLVSTPYYTGQQWDAPNGWAPLQWISIKGLRNYGFNDLAEEIKSRWIKLNTKVYHSTGKMLEKYNVENLDLLSGGGEYPVQDGFGWTNGVLMKLLME